MKKLVLILISLIWLNNPSLAQFPNNAAQDSIRKITKIDHDNILAQLKITNLRQGANGNDSKAPNAANYDEAKANPFPDLPDALTLKNDKKVNSAKMWWAKGMGTSEFPKVETGLMDGEIAFRQHSGGHTPAPNWESFIAFAERYFR